mmetsp:Transcript_27474/g.37326  ORF Transcript_27474/g.37326 Transcript_27474/m.37326 type:complete len:136 (+) Transcript_27474:936-1343(+)
MFIPLTGYLADRISPRIMIPVAFSCRAIVTINFLELERPDTLWAYILSTLMVVFSLFESVSVEVLFLKKLPGDIRGVMTSLFGIFGMAGILIFTLVGSIIYEDTGAEGPFIVLFCCDVFVATLVIILGCCGKLKD